MKIMEDSVVLGYEICKWLDILDFLDEVDIYH